MARLWHSGGEIGSNSGAIAYIGPDGGWNGLTTITRDTTTFRGGVASVKFDSGAGGSAPIVQNAGAFVDGRNYFARGYVSVAAAPTNASVILLMGTAQARLRTDGAMELSINGVAQGSPSAAIADGAWHRVELSANAVATTTWAAAELRVDGVSVATWSGSAARGSAGFNFGWQNGPGTNKVLNLDDLALNDSTGAVNNTWPGDGRVVLLLPTSDNLVGTGWTNDNAATTGLFNSVKNTPPLGIADTTSGGGGHMIRNATSNANTNYDANMTTYTAAGIGAADTINAIIPWVATAAPVVTSAKLGTVGVASNPAITNINLGAAGTSGAFWQGNAAATYDSGWKWSRGTVTEAPSVTLGTAPVMRITQVTSSTRIAMVCAMFMYVDYTPAVVVAGIPDVGMALTVT